MGWGRRFFLIVVLLETGMISWMSEEHSQVSTRGLKHAHFSNITDKTQGQLTAMGVAQIITQVMPRQTPANVAESMYNCGKAQRLALTRYYQRPSG